MDAEQRQMAADLWINPTELSRKPACKQLRNCIHHRHLLLLSPKADTHFTIPIPRKVQQLIRSSNLEEINEDIWLFKAQINTKIIVYSFVQFFHLSPLEIAGECTDGRIIVLFISSASKNAGIFIYAR